MSVRVAAPRPVPRAASKATFPLTTTPAAGAGTPLYMVFNAETSHIRNLRRRISRVCWMGCGRPRSRASTPAFSKVEMTGQPGDVWRNAATGEEVKAPAGGAIEGEEELLHFVSFSGDAVVNTKTEAGAAPSGGAAAAAQTPEGAAVEGDKTKKPIEFIKRNKFLIGVAVLVLAGIVTIVGLFLPLAQRQRGHGGPGEQEQSLSEYASKADLHTGKTCRPPRRWPRPTRPASRT